MLKKIIWLFVASLLINVLSGCNPYSKKKFKELIQERYSYRRINNNLKGDFCFCIGSVKFPFTQEAIDENETDWDKSIKRRLTRTLPVFTEIGLLSRKPIEGKTGLYHYELTELGKEYQYFYVEHYYDDGSVLYNNSFCYGIAKVDKITEIKVKNDSKQPYPFKHEVTVDYDFHVEDVPEWVVLNQDKLSKRYGTTIELEGQTYNETIVYQGEKDGYLHFSRGGGDRSMVPRLRKEEGGD